jgi:hypothetical protein
VALNRDILPKIARSFQVVAGFSPPLVSCGLHAGRNTARDWTAIGYWERETDAYNERRYGKPWCARVTGVDSRGKLVYEWAEWTGHLGQRGLLRAACKPGEIIAWGQKDLRRPHRSDHEILLMGDDGRMTELSVVEAVRELRK